MSSDRNRRRPRGFVGLAVIVAGVSAGLGAGAYALFGDAGRATSTVAAGTVELDWAATLATQLPVSLRPLTPGNATQQLVNLQNTGSVSITELQLAYNGATNAPTTDFSDGLQYRLEKCSTPWGGTPDNYTCPGQVTELITDRPVTGRTNITGAGSMMVGGTDYLRFTFRLPVSSPPAAKSATNTLNFLILGNQRPGQQR